jgi:hypothetical protein
MKTGSNGGSASIFDAGLLLVALLVWVVCSRRILARGILSPAKLQSSQEGLVD